MSSLQQKAVRVRIPASTANLGPGFDTLGMALSLYAWIEMKIANRTAIHLYGEELHGIPLDKSNLIYEVAQAVFVEAGVEIPEIEISMYSEIPLTRGLGSSASAIVGGLVAANALLDHPLPLSKLFDMATQIEQHPDNVGASLFGGMITATWDGEHADYIKITPPADLDILVAIPQFQLSTKAAREVLPQSLSMQDVVFNVSHVSLLTAAFCTGRLDMIATAMKDRIHQPYRGALIPGMTQILEEAHRHGALGVALSGAGPTLLALVNRQAGTGAELEQFLGDVLMDHEIDARTLWLKPDLTGPQVIEVSAQDSFADFIKGEVAV
ncbi:homoserine kinase [Paenibacillus shirakamiensis]|nr:homoserine kinase [Paenibacillus shirakamiensis]